MDAFATARLRATRLAPEDLDDLVRLHLDPEVSKFLGGVRTAAATASYLDTNLQHWADHGFGLYVFRTPDGAFCGRGGLRHIDLEGVRELEIAYSLARNAWGQGLATEAAEALVRIWQAAPARPSLVGVVTKGNSASEQVLRKTGFRYERDARFHEADVSVFRQSHERP